MVHSGYFRVLASLTTLAFLLGFAGVANAECEAFPKVTWWKGLSHEYVKKLISTKYGGNWAPYIQKWERQAVKLADIHSRGATAIVSKNRIKLRDAGLQSYIDKVRKRISIIRCLSLGDTAARPAMPGDQDDLGAGKARAEAAGCLECHGASGISGKPSVPNLAGQNGLYLVKQLRELRLPRGDPSVPFGSIERYDPTLHTKVAGLGDRDIWNIAVYFSGQPCGTGEAQGAASNPVPAKAETCVKCHGDDGKSDTPEIPNLAGQNERYLQTQLLAFRASAGEIDRAKMKSERYHYVMAIYAGSLDDDDIKSFTAYYSAMSCR